MASKTAILAIRIVTDAKSVKPGMEEAGSSVDKLGSRLDAMSVPAGLALASLVALAKGAGDAASDLEQSTGAVESVFKQYAAQVEGFAADAATNVGLAKNEYQELASVIGSQLKNMGIPMEAVAGQTNDLVNLGADLAATFGGTTADAVGALSSLLRGERDPIERYGVSMNQAAIDAEKAALGLTGLTGEADKNADLQATLAILMRQTGDAAGQFARETDSAAGSAQIAAAEWENAQAALGEQLLPYMVQGATIAADLAKWLGENSEVATILAVVIGGLAAGILIMNGALRAYQAAQAIATAAAWASNAAWLANPITWIVLGIVAAIALVVAIVVLLVQHWDEVSAGLEVMGQTAADVWDGFIGWIQSAIGWVEDLVGWIGELASGAVPGWVKDVMGWSGGNARMAVTTTETVDTPIFSRMAAMAAPGISAAAADEPTAPARFASTSQATPAGNTYVFNTTVQGAIDKTGTARTIRGVMGDYLRTSGGIAAGGVSWS